LLLLFLGIELALHELALVVEARGERPRIGPIEADQVIDPKPIVERYHVASAAPEPSEVDLPHRSPRVRREPTVLAVGVELNGRDAYQAQAVELGARSPHIGAVTRDHEG